jgi:hypothetical protein
MLNVDATTRFLTALMKRDTDALGFLPPGEIARRAARGRVLLVSNNGQPCGYGVLGFDPDWIPLHQVCVARDACGWSTAAGYKKGSGVFYLHLHCNTHEPSDGPPDVLNPLPPPCL